MGDSFSEADRRIPLVVDVDGTLIKGDLLLENFYAMIRQKPLSIVRVPLWLLRGKAYLKDQMARRVNIDARTLPYQEEFLAYLRGEFSRGRTLVLATASHKKFAENINQFLGIFKEVLASDERRNISGKSKLKLLLERYGEKGFDYAGNSGVDLHIFPHAREALLVCPFPGVLPAARKTANVQRVFEGATPGLSLYVKAVRVYQWLKNSLLFVPLVTSHEWNNVYSVMGVVLGFLSFGLCASSGYIFNDLLDLDSDRNHPRKRYRPFAGGDLSLWTGSALMVALQLAGLIIAAALSWKFFLLVVVYSALSLAYTLHLKTYVLIDVLVLAGLYTMRIVAGAVLIDVPLSFWLFAFSIFIFFSLALVKRCSELITLSKTDREYAGRRDYSVSDLDHLREMGIASGYLAIIIFALYINSSDVVLRYAHPKVLWMIVPILFYWVSRLWLKTGRGEMKDDPIIFSIKDRGSRFVAVAILLVIILAL